MPARHANSEQNGRGTNQGVPFLAPKPSVAKTKREPNPGGVFGKKGKGRSCGKDLFSGGACKDQTPAGRMCLAEVLARMGHTGTMCLAEVLSRIGRMREGCV